MQNLSVAYLQTNRIAEAKTLLTKVVEQYEKGYEKVPDTDRDKVKNLLNSWSLLKQAAEKSGDAATAQKMTENIARITAANQQPAQ